MPGLLPAGSLASTIRRRHYGFIELRLLGEVIVVSGESMVRRAILFIYPMEDAFYDVDVESKQEKHFIVMIDGTHMETKWSEAFMYPAAGYINASLHMIL